VWHQESTSTHLSASQPHSFCLPVSSFDAKIERDQACIVQFPPYPQFRPIKSISPTVAPSRPSPIQVCVCACGYLAQDHTYLQTLSSCTTLSSLITLSTCFSSVLLKTHTIRSTSLLTYFPTGSSILIVEPVASLKSSSFPRPNQMR
jgi:hypothetical protein